MYVRIARFEGAQGDWDERIAEVRSRIEGGGQGDEQPPITRAMMLVDRENSRGASVMFCESEEDLKRVDQFMNNMTPPGGTGNRVSVEMYEVAVDATPN